MGQISLTKEQAEAAGNALGLNFSDEEIAVLMTVPYRGSLPTAVPTDPLIYRLYEVVSVYGTTMKALIEEEFGDGIMSAIDFTMDITREENPAGDRVKVEMTGKFLPYKTF
ncbi:MAG: Cyanate hydratase [SAR116 cluster bacterium MED-G04]|nr:MAG: Cyanate hydratase [SAR116 cluster bacterium MED-G04]